MTQVIINNETTRFNGKKSALGFIRDFIRKERRNYRLSHNITDNVNELPPAELTGIALVDIASYKLNNMGAEMLIKLLTDFGVNAKIEEV